MAEVPYTVTTTANGDLLLTWATVTESDTFQQYELSEVVSEISCHVTGTFGGATVTMTGGNVSTDILDLVQIGGAAASCTAARLL